MSVEIPFETLTKLKSVLEGLYSAGYRKEQLKTTRDVVYAEFQPVFHPDHLPDLKDTEVLKFLQFKHNLHWSSLERLGPRITADMDKLRTGLTILTDESRSIEERFDEAISIMHGVRYAVATPILHVLHPHKYGVWNGITQKALQLLDLFPDVSHDKSLGEKYAAINEVLLATAKALKIDLWTVDGLWWDIVKADENLPEETGVSELVTEGNDAEEIFRFRIEDHLHDFMYANWMHIDLSQHWDLFGREGDMRPGHEYHCPKVGAIDLLAKHKSENKWLVIEMKRDYSSDKVVGQVLRYMGWVKQNLAKDGEVHGLIIGLFPDVKLEHALIPVPNLEFRRYKVSFSLEESVT